MYSGLLKEKMQIEIDEHEIGYIALHVHAAIVDEMFLRQWKLQEQSGNVFHLLRKKLEIPLMSCLWDIID